MDEFNQAVQRLQKTIAEMQWRVNGVEQQAKHDRLIWLVLLVTNIISGIVIISAFGGL